MFWKGRNATVRQTALGALVEIRQSLVEQPGKLYSRV
jgi:hypothetical protein